ncbi:MAG: hypothetical protein JW828_10445 [Sedimentisphaerales bacterium]|nr:hypothetical protein [Sedimentisphaerales bacterium]
MFARKGKQTSHRAVQRLIVGSMVQAESAEVRRDTTGADRGQRPLHGVLFGANQWSFGSSQSGLACLPPRP